MKIKSSDLVGPALDWAVAKSNGIPLVLSPFTGAKNFVMVGQNMKPTSYEYKPSTSWAQGGPIIEREIGSLLYVLKDKHSRHWSAHSKDATWRHFGPTPLIAAMRVFVASKMGDEIEIPEELL